MVDKPTKTRGYAVHCKKVVIAANAALLPFTVGTVVVGLVLEFGTFLVEDHIQSVFEDLTASLNIAGDDDIDIGTYDLASIISGLGMGFIFVGLGSSIIAAIGMVAGKIDVYQLGLTYCVLLGVTILVQVGLVLVITIHRGLIDTAIKPALRVHLREGYNGFNGTDPFTQTWNLLMLTMRCCGVESSTDFQEATVWNRRLFQEGWWFTLATPILCCRFDVKVPGDFSCAVNPSTASSNYRKGCYEEVWSIIGEHKVYLLMVGSLLFVVQLALFVSAIVHTKTVYTKSRKSNNNDKNERTNSSKRSNGNKSIADLISSTTGILSQTSSPDASPDVRNLIDQGLAGNMFSNANMNGANRNHPFMSFMGNFGQPPMSPLNQLLQQYCLQGRFANPTDPFNPLNVFSTAFFNPYSNGGGVAENHRFDDMAGLMRQQNVAGNQMIVPFMNRFPRFDRLASQFSLQGLPGIENGSPDSLRRETSRACELRHDDTDSWREGRDRTNSRTESRDRTSSCTGSRGRTNSCTD